MKSCSIYENENMRKVTGDTLRPGGFFLTDKAIKMCNFKYEDILLDIGCGMGATVNRLKNEYNLNAYGIDPSQKLIQLGKEKYKDNKLEHGKGEDLPYENSFFKGVLAECTMSLMEDYEKTLIESKRVLKKDGCFVVSDVYARKTEGLEELQNYNINSCMRGLFDVNVLSNKIKNLGFEIVCFEDWTDLLKQLMVKIIFRYGSMAIFWNLATCTNCNDFQKKLTACKPGYFLLIAKKK